jgi:hypothetical protein
MVCRMDGTAEGGRGDGRSELRARWDVDNQPDWFSLDILHPYFAMRVKWMCVCVCCVPCFILFPVFQSIYEAITNGDVTEKG